MNLLIRSGHLYDPIQGWHDRVQDLGIAGDRLVRPMDLGSPDRVIDAQDLVVTAAAIDPAAWVAPYEAIHLQQSFGFPGPDEIGKNYAERGYCHVHHPFLSPVTALAVSRQLERLPFLDSSVSLAVALYDLEPLLSAGQPAEAAENLSRLAAQLGTFGLYLAETSLDYRLEVYRHKNRGADQILPFMGELARILGQPLNIPAAALEPGAWKLVPAGTHIQRLSELPAMAPNQTFEGPVSVTADLGLPWPGKILAPAWPTEPAGEPVCSVDHGFSRLLSWQQREGTGFSRESAITPRMQGLQPSDFALTGAGANMALINDWAGFIRTILESASMDRYLTMTRSTPARILAMPDRGHLKWGARADLACYPKPGADSARTWAKAFSRCHTLILGGRILMRNYRWIAPLGPGRVRRSAPAPNQSPAPDFLEEGLSLRPETLQRLHPLAHDRGGS